ncbi:MAG TPA: hypothetical protein DSN98_06090 [Thermoplasmata archaeon]|nr:MAG TPA: hypothetical protein DSN98_06090 [Thermoplasmata archaeon]
MKICVVTESASAKKNPHRKMERSDHLCLDDDKMIQVNENASQPTTKEDKKCILSESMIRSNGQSPEKTAGGFPMNFSKNALKKFSRSSHDIHQLLLMLVPVCRIKH